MRISKGLRQSYQVQDFAHEALMALKQSLTKDGQLCVSREDAAAVKHLVSAWEAAQQRIAFHRRMPSPGVLKPEHKPKRRRTMWPVLEVPPSPVPNISSE